MIALLLVIRTSADCSTLARVLREQFLHVCKVTCVYIYIYVCVITYIYMCVCVIIYMYMCVPVHINMQLNGIHLSIYLI